MSTQDILLSQKFNNYNYAPGIATYGIDGKTGQAGTDGNNIYFTDCNLLTDTDKDLKILAELIANNYLPVKGSTTQINRSYKNNDLFFDYNGIIYQLTNIDDLIGNKDIGGVYSDYFNIAGKINIADVSNIFEWVGDRMVLNSSTYSGYDVVTINNPSNAENYINKDAVVNIISDNVNENSNIEMIKLQSIDDVDIEDGNLSVYYKTTENAFYLDSNKPIVINGDVKLNNDNNTNNEYDNFSTILTSNDTVTYFKHICDKLRYNVLYDSEVNRYKLIIYQEDGGRDDLEYLINRNETVYGKVYDGENNQVLLKLNDIVSSPTSGSNYYDYMPDYNLSIGLNTFDIFKFNYKIIDNDENELIHEVEVSENRIIHNLTDDNGIINIDLSLKLTNNDIGPDAELFDASVLNNAFNNNIWGIIITQNTVLCKSNIIKINYSGGRPFIEIDEDNTASDKINSIICTKHDINNQYKYVFDPTMGNNSLTLHIFPLTRINNNDSTKVFDYIYLKQHAPILIEIKIPENIKNTCALYFTLNYSEEKFSINNMMLFKQNNLLNIPTTTSQPCIVSYLPDSVESVQRFSLLHNTEVFINYQE